MKMVAEEGHKIISGQQPGSVLTLSDVSGTSFDQESVAALKSMVAANAPYVRRAAVFGISGLQSLIYDAVQAFSRRKIPNFSTRQEALDWLVNGCSVESPTSQTRLPADKVSFDAGAAKTSEAAPSKTA